MSLAPEAREENRIDPAIAGLQVQSHQSYGSSAWSKTARIKTNAPAVFFVKYAK